LNSVIAQVHQLQQLLSHGCFDEVLLLFSETKKFSIQLRAPQKSLKVCFGDDAPSSTDLQTNLSFAFEKICQMLDNKKIRIKPMALESTSVDKDDSVFRSCLKDFLTTRLLEEFKRMKKAKMAAIGAGTFAVAAGTGAVVATVPSIAGAVAVAIPAIMQAIEDIKELFDEDQE
jgi:hypothetical protein